MAAGCGRPPLGADNDGGPGALGPPPFACVPWAPAAESWSSLPASRPASIDGSVTNGTLRPSASGRYIYAVAVWLDEGRTRRQIVRTPDLGASWCLVATTDPIADVLPTFAKETDLYAVTAAADPVQRRLLRTIDGGATWTMAAGGFPVPYVADGQKPFIVAADSNVVWINQESRLHLTRDGGTTWTTRELPTIGEPLVDPAQPQRLFVSGAGDSVAYVSRDWGATWTTIFLPAFTGCSGNSPSSCGFSVDSSSVLYRGNAFVSSTGVVESVEVWRSSDWGQTWTRLSNMPSSSLDGVPSTLGSHVPGALFIATRDGMFGSADGGLHWKLVTASNSWSLTAATASALVGKNESSLVATTDGGETWQPLPVVPDPTSLAASPAAPYPVWTGPGPLRSDDGGVTWRAPSPSSWAGVVVDGADADVAYTLGTTGIMMTRTEDGGATWETFVSPTASPVYFLAVCPPPRSCLFVLDPTMGSAVMVRSDDHGRTWRAPTPWTNWDIRSQVVVSPDDPDHLLQGRSDAVYETHDGGQYWNYHKLGFPVAGIAFLTDMEVVGIDDRRRILRSSDGGISWAAAADQPLLIPAAGLLLPRLVQSSRRPNVLFVLHDDQAQALFRSDDSGQTWTAAASLGDKLEGEFLSPLVSEVVDLGQSFLAIVPNYGLVSFR